MASVILFLIVATAVFWIIVSGLYKLSLRYGVEINLLIATIVAVVSQVLDEWGAYTYQEPEGFKFILLWFVISLIITIASIVILIYMLIHKDIKSATICLATIFVLFSPLVLIIPIIFLMFIAILISRIAGNGVKQKIIYIISTLVIISRIMFHYSEYNIMNVRAIMFSKFPSTCQQHTSISDDVYICYHYKKEDGWAGSYSLDDNWLIIDKTDNMLGSIDTWPENLKNFFGFAPSSRDELLKEQLKVKRVEPHIYWVSRVLNF